MKKTEFRKSFKLDETIREIVNPRNEIKISRPLLGHKLPAGFPSPADDYIEKSLDLNEYLIAHPAATFFIRVEGDSMIGAGIHDNDILIVDRALDAGDNSIIIAALDGYLTVKRLIKTDKLWYLHPENSDYEDINLEEGSDFTIWGVVTYVIHKAE